MREEIRQQLLALNQTFYGRFADAFARSRVQPAPGFYRLLDYLPQPCPALLDVGCGDGRLGRFLLARQRIGHYSGVDFSQALLERARAGVAGDFYQRDLAAPGCLDGLPRYPATACLATLQHIPGRAQRLRLLREMGRHLAAEGRLILANWQFGDNPRQQRKIADWSVIGLTAADVEANDHLLTWQREGFGYRYVALIDAAETADLAAAAGLTLAAQFRSDGREGDLNLYTVLSAPVGR